MDSLFQQTGMIGELFASGGEMGALMSTIDWSLTPLGPAAQWPQSLRTALSICLHSRFPMLLWWGPEMVMLYNDAYRPILGATKHPRSMGQRGQECWPEIWDVIGPMLEGVLHKGEATWSDNQLLLLDRNGYMEECYFTFSYSPIHDESGTIGGIFTAVTETTGEVLGGRRLHTLRELSAHATDAQTVEATYRMATLALKGNPADIPFALLYMLDSNGIGATLQAHVGLPSDTPASQKHLLLTETTNKMQWPLAQVIQSGAATLVENMSERFGSITSHLGQASLQRALVLPVAKSGQESLYGFLIVGINPRRALDEDYRSFFTLVAGQMAANIANARAHQEERERAEALAELDHAKTTFFSNISHEFRTPLTLLLGPLQDVLNDEAYAANPEQRERLEIMRHNALRLLKLVNTLLDFSHIEAGRVQALYEPTDLAAFTAELASTFRSAIERADMQLVVDCPPLSEPIYVDHEMWEKIVLNLLSNAFKFTLQGQITVRLRQLTDSVALDVQDTGVGIAATDMPHIFERFHRLRPTQARTFEGSGIGLALVQELVRLHGGTVHVASTLNQGTTFTVSLPPGTAHLPAEQIKTNAHASQYSLTLSHADSYIEEALRWLSHTDRTNNSSSIHDTQAMAASLEKDLGDGFQSDSSAYPRNATIVLADDNADMRDYLTRLLRPYYQVRAVTNGKEALQAMREQTPDLVISDIMMPGMDGFQLLHHLRSDPHTRLIPIMLLSAKAGEEATADGLKAGADDYLIKPFSTRELLARVATRIEMARMRAGIAQREHEHAQHLQQLAEAALLINSMHPIDEMLAIITAKARQIIAAHQSVTSFTSNYNWAQTINSVSLSAKYEQWRDYAAPITGKDIYALICRTNTPMRMTQAELEAHPAWHHFSSEVGNHPPMRGWLAAPLMTREGHNLGVIQLSDKYEGDFTEEDEAILVQLAQMASVAIVNSQLYQQSRDTLKAREQLLSMVSHDLKNPLGAIKGYTQLLQRALKKNYGALDERTTLTLDRINSTVTRMTGLINELLDLTRLQAGQPIELDLQSTDIVALMQQAIAEQQQQTQKHTIRLHTTTSELHGDYDAQRLERVFTNLLSNAIKYSPDAPFVDVSIDHETQEEQTIAIIAIRDYGIGIPQQDIPHIFEQFHRAGNVIGTIKGTGVGLASAYEITKRHSGTITVESNEGVGSTFTVRLPL